MICLPNAETWLAVTISHVEFGVILVTTLPVQSQLKYNAKPTCFYPNAPRRIRAYAATIVGAFAINRTTDQ